MTQDVPLTFFTTEERGIFDRARSLAFQFHWNQIRRFTGAPYVTHCDEVAGIVASLPNPSALAVAAAYLHDSVEDAETEDLARYRLNAIESVVCPEVAEMVLTLTRPRKPKAESLPEYHYALRLAGHEVQNVKLADIYSNLRSLRHFAHYEKILDWAEPYVAEKETQVHFLAKGYSFLRDDCLRLVDDVRDRLHWTRNPVPF